MEHIKHIIEETIQGIKMLEPHAFNNHAIRLLERQKKYCAEDVETTTPCEGAGNGVSQDEQGQQPKGGR